MFEYRPRTLLLTALAMIAFAANSVLCRLALGRQLIDPASFAAVSVITAAVTLLSSYAALASPRPRPRQLAQRRSPAGVPDLVFVRVSVAQRRYRRIDPVWSGAADHDRDRVAGR